MLDHPFTIFAPYADRLRIVFFDKSDPSMSDHDRAKLLGCDRAAALHQMHGARVVRISEESDRTEQADGLMTDQKKLVLQIRAADCQNFIVYATEKNIVGLLHVGWKGILAQAIPSFFATLKKEFDVDAQETLVGAGPSLCKNCAEFSDPLLELPGIPKDCIDDHLVDLPEIALRQFLDVGVLKKSFECMPGCTKHEPEKFWTYRGGDREAVKQGRTNVLAAVLLRE